MRPGLDFYDRLIDRLLAAGISPMATLYHWDTPLPLEHRGGWMNRSTAERFAEYSAAAGKRFGDRVAQWVTLNEPASVTLNGYALGVHAPGRGLLFDALPSVRHQLLGHGLAVQALRAQGVAGAVGVTNLHSPVRPASGSPTDRMLARVFDFVLNRLYADPILLGRFPRLPLIARPWFRSMRSISDADLATIHQPLDFYGLNYYYPVKVATGRGVDSPSATAEAMLKVPFHMAAFPEYERTGFGWPVAPDHLGILLRELKDRYGSSLPPLYITESGASFPEPDHVTGPIPDAGRISYLAAHLGQAVEATSPGRHGARRRTARLLRLDADGQLRMGGRLLAALRPGARRFHEPQAHAERLVLLVPGPRAGTAGPEPRPAAVLLVAVGPVDALGALDLLAEVLLRPKERDDDRGGDQQKNEPAHGELPSLPAKVSGT